jgi:hypothetical protein
MRVSTHRFAFICPAWDPAALRVVSGLNRSAGAGVAPGEA